MTKFSNPAKLRAALALALLLAALLCCACAFAADDDFYVVEFTRYENGSTAVQRFAKNSTVGPGYKVNDFMATKPLAFVLDPNDVENTDMSSADIINAVREGMEEWNSVLATPMLIYNGTGDVNLGPTAKTSRSGFNSISFVKIPNENGKVVLAKTWTYVSTKRLTDMPASRGILECDILFNTDVLWVDVNNTRLSGGYDLQSTATHELGHTLGLGDVDDFSYSYVTMYGSGVAESTHQRTLEKPDLVGLSKLYKVPGYGDPYATAAPTATPTPQPTATPKPTATPAPATLTGTVKTSGGNLNMRSGPSTSASRIASIPNKTVVKVLEAGPEWTKIQYDGKTGYVSSAYLTLNGSATPAPTQTPTPAPTAQQTAAPTANPTEKPTAQPSATPAATPTSAPTSAPTAKPTAAPAPLTATVNVSTRLNMRRTPSTSGALVTQLNAGVTVTVLSQSNGWAEVQYGSYHGYVSAQYLKYNTTPAVTPAPTTKPAATPTV